MASRANQKSFDSMDIDVISLLQEIRELRQRIDDGALEPALRLDGMPEVAKKNVWCRSMRLTLNILTIYILVLCNTQSRVIS
ncbi:hypothetical protein GcM1_219005 [Golovinomyces cichoracearum]|uniref:Uncharacterized protein n=1 Tax=Golovinomyces cichoracearum TaxID=62708 RepID=A0A420IS76_9PEZI|nr:hypothetical protein GcM1_219005 [Golovinomyces cichoracearum]